MAIDPTEGLGRMMANAEGLGPQLNVLMANLDKQVETINNFASSEARGQPLQPLPQEREMPRFYMLDQQSADAYVEIWQTAVNEAQTKLEEAKRRAEQMRADSQKRAEEVMNWIAASEAMAQDILTAHNKRTQGNGSVT